MSENNTKAHKKIALMVAQPEESYYEAFIKGFLREAFSDDFDVCIFAMYQRHQATKVRARGEALIYSLVDYDMYDAVVVLATSIQTSHVLEYIEEELHKGYDRPVIFVDEESEYFYNVKTDNYMPIKQVVSHLIEVHGYKDIAFLNGNEFHPHARERLKSFLDCMEEHGLKVPEERIFFGDFWYNSGRAMAEQLLLDREHMPEAVVCANDCMAIGLIEELQEAGVMVPSDIAVTGYDDTPEGKEFVVPLTSVPMPTEACGEYTMQCIRAMLKGEEIKAFSASVPLSIGRSCGCVLENKKVENVRPTEDKFDFNVGTMTDDIFLQTEISGVLNVMLSYIDQIRPFESFHLCLNSELVDEEFFKENDGTYTFSDIMIDAISCGAQKSEMDRISLQSTFSRKELLPGLFTENDKPRAYYFTPIFFEEKYFGYAAVSYGDTLKCYNAAYKRWLSYVMHGLASFFKIKLLTKKNEELSSAQIRDSVTGSYNYNGLLRVILEGVKDNYAEGSCELTLLAMEICGLIDVYTRLGRQIGNKVIADASQMLLTTLDNERLAYLGNGEFLIIWYADETDGESLPEMERFLERFSEHAEKNGIADMTEVVFSTHSGRIDDEDTLAKLIGEAVSKKNSVKIKEQQKKNSVFTGSENHKMELVADILDNNKLSYHFQPIVDVKSGRIFAYEALMRATTEESVSPLEIIKYATHMVRLSDVEKATFSNVLKLLSENEDLFEGRKIFINSIPGTQIDDKTDALICEQLQKYSGQIVVELTEQTEMEDLTWETFKEKYERLGVKTAVDDYGTGYSNIYNLLRYMPGFVKVDRMLIAGIQTSPQKQHFVKEIIKFSHDNDIVVLAEGVETVEELRMVISLGVDLIQGYYTARPNEKILPSIDQKIQNEIIQFGRHVAEKAEGMVFQAGNDGILSLVKIASTNYGKIRFSSEFERHTYVTINGMRGFEAKIEIVVEDGYTGQIELKDVHLAVQTDQPTIRIGKNCNVTIVLDGENIIEQGGILVPESSKLVVQGDGNLTVNKIAANGAGIGNTKDEKHGDLYFKQDGMITIRGNVMHGVGIGSGYGGNIYIEKGRYFVGLTGENAVGIGTLYADANIQIRSCAIDINIKNLDSVGIGSLLGNANIDISYVGMSGKISGRKTVFIGSQEGTAQINITEATTELEIWADQSCGIGSLIEHTDIALKKFAAQIVAEGKNSIAMGNLSKTANIHMHNGNLYLYVRNILGFDVGAEVFEIINGHSEFVLNGKAVAREIIEGEM